MGFLDNIKGKIDKMLDEKKQLDEIKFEAKKEAMRDLKPELTQMYKQQELDRLKKKSIPIGDKIGKGFGEIGDSIFSKDRIDRVLESNNSMNRSSKSNNSMNSGGSSLPSGDRIAEMMGGSSGKKNKR
jgi:hypothetical protein